MKRTWPLGLATALLLLAYPWPSMAIPYCANCNCSMSCTTRCAIDSLSNLSTCGHSGNMCSGFVDCSPELASWAPAESMTGIPELRMPVPAEITPAEGTCYAPSATVTSSQR